VGKGGRRIRLTTLSLSCTDCLETWESETSGTLRVCTGIILPFPSIILINLYLCRRTHILGQALSTQAERPALVLTFWHRSFTFKF
jgi:hypothetical protein